MSTTSPPDDELKAALIALKSENPALGITKTHALLLTSYPAWAVSEKRTRKVMQSEGLVIDGACTSPRPETIAVYPSSRIIPDFDVLRWTPKVEVKYFSKKKGKGLVATEDITEGETIWKEDPFILAPEWEIFDMQVSSTACGFCSTPLDLGSPLTIPCPASAILKSLYCPFRFCNRLCLSRSARCHPLVCAAANPASIHVIMLARDARWMALYALVQCTSRVLLAAQMDGEEALDMDWKIMRGFAELGLEERFKYSFKLAGRSEPDRAAWKKAHELYIRAFSEPRTVVEKKRLAKILKKPLNPEVSKELFDYDTGFLKGLGKMSLNLEAHGGLYTLHSHLNHSCDPNVSVRHLDQRTALSRITVLARRPIKAGEELLVTYVNPGMGVKKRRRELEAWGFGVCGCVKCILQEKDAIEEDGGDADLESELKAGLGVM